MATTKTIGSAGRDYSTVQAWEDALLAVLVDEQIGECYKDNGTWGEVVGAVVTFAGSTTALSTDIILRPATGEGFRAGIATNRPAYNTANGVGLSRTAGYGQTIVISEDYVTIDGLQVANTSATGNTGTLDVSSASCTNICVKNSLWELTTCNSGTGNWTRFRSGKAWNNLIVSRAATNGDGVHFDYIGGTIDFINNTIVRPSDKTAGGSAITSLSGTTIVKNCQIFGFTTLATSGLTYTTCQTDKATPPTGCTQVTYANQFTTTTDATRDFRTKAGADSIGAGTVDSTNLPDGDDIVGTARGAAWDVGFFEYVSAAVTPNPTTDNQNFMQIN